MHKLNCGLTALKDTYVYMYTYPYPLQDDEGNARTDPKCAYWKFDSKYVHMLFRLYEYYFMYNHELILQNHDTYEQSQLQGTRSTAQGCMHTHMPTHSIVISSLMYFIQLPIYICTFIEYLFTCMA